MTRNRSRERHLDLATILGYLENTLDSKARGAADDHLGRPCAACLEQLRAVGALLETMRRDSAGEVPAWLHERALAAFEGAERPSRAARIAEALARLVFDSARTPLPALARRSVGEARRLRFELGDASLDLELEAENASTRSLGGRLSCDEPALWTLHVRAGGETREVRPDAGGAFAAGGLPAGPLELRVEGPANLWRLPEIEP
jgi:hypothetical protein